MLCGGVVPVALAIAATVTSQLTESERVAVTAWVAVAVVGTASVIAAGAASRFRNTEVTQDRERARFARNSDNKGE